MSGGDELAALESSLVAAAVALGQALEGAGMRLACAESCTGGLIARAMTETGGSSRWFDRGFVTYTDDSKRQMLGVRSDTLAAHGAVSEAVAREMAAGALAASAARMTVAVTGIAGPSGAVPGKPVGTVCFGWALQPAGGGEPLVVSQTLRVDGDRARVRLRSGQHALVRGLELLRRELQDRPPAA
ncbi:MAG TPA: CinA family protein [Burkholderiaceae bacterium]|nr:CinA family protein [Burkholderiaceae bacterium]